VALLPRSTEIQPCVASIRPSPPPLSQSPPQKKINSLPRALRRLAPRLPSLRAPCPRQAALAACLWGLPWPWLRALALAACPAHGGLLLPWPWLRALPLAACHGGLPWPWQHALSFGCSCLALGCMPWPALAAWPWLHAMALAACVGLGCMPWPWLRALALAACHRGLLQGLGFRCLGLGCVRGCMPWPWPHALALAACLGLRCMPWGTALAACLGLGCLPWALAACHGLGCVPWPWLHALALAACHGLGCVPWPWHHALSLGCMPWPSLRALALAACLGGLMQALAPCLVLGLRLPWPWPHAMGGCLGLGCDCLALGCMPWPWLRALALAVCLGLGLGCVPWGAATWPSLPCPQILSDFPKNEGFLEKEVICPKEAGAGHGRVPRGMHATPHRPASSRTPAKLARAFSPFCVPKFSP